MVSVERIAQRYVGVCGDRLGMPARFDPDDGVVVFEAHGATWLLFPSAGDPEYLRLMLPNFYRVTPEEPLGELAMLRVCQQVTTRCKGAKVLLDPNGGLSTSVEMLVAPPDCLPTEEQLVAVLPRAMHMALTAARRAYEEVQLVGIAQASA